MTDGRKIEATNGRSAAFGHNQIDREILQMDTDLEEKSLATKGTKITKGKQ